MMESASQKLKYCYTREQILALRNIELLRGNSEGLLRKSIISKKLTAKAHRKRKFNVIQPSVSIAVPIRTQEGQGDTLATTPTEEGLVAQTDDTADSKKLWRRTAGVPPGSPFESSQPGEHTPQGYTRHHSGSSGTEETVMRTGGSGKELDWTLGCGKWRHRSKSGSERGTSKQSFFPGTARGRGRGDVYDGFASGRGRSFVRRPYQPHLMRGKGFKQYNGYHPGDQSDEFRHDCGGDRKHCSSFSESPFQPHYGQCTPDSEEAFTSLHLSPAKPEEAANDHDINRSISRPPGILNIPGGNVSESSGQGSETSAQVSLSPDDRIKPPPTLWYYLDSSRVAQGPFDDATMAAWFIAGHFPISVEVRRQCDHVFSPLTDFLAWSGRFPFVDSHKLPPILEPRVPATDLLALGTPGGFIGERNASAPTTMCSQNSPAHSITSTVATTAISSSPSSVVATTPVPSTTEFYNDEVKPQLSVCDLNKMTKATLEEVRRLQEDARLLLQRASKLGTDPIPLPTDASGLQISNSIFQHQQFSSELEVPSPLSAWIFEADKCAPVRGEHVLLADRSQQSLLEQDLATPLTKQEQPDTMLTFPVRIQRDEETSASAAVEPTVSPDLVTEDDESTNAAISEKVPEGGLLPSLISAVEAVSLKKKKKKRNRHKAMAKEDLLPSIKPEPHADEPVMLIDNALSETGDDFVRLGFGDDEDEWRSSKTPAHTGAVTTSLQVPASKPSDEDTNTGKKSKKNKQRQKLSAEGQRQQAWIIEEARRKELAAQRLAAEDAEVARIAEEVRLAVAEQARLDAEKRREALRLQRQREAAQKRAAESLAGLRLPAAAKWGASSNATVGSSASFSGHNTPMPLAEILTSEAAAAKKATSAIDDRSVTFAQKLSVNAGLEKQTILLKNSTTEEGIAVSKQQSSAIKARKTVNEVKQMKLGTSQSNKVTKTACTKVPVVSPPSKGSLSIWDLPPDASTITTTSKKGKRKAGVSMPGLQPTASKQNAHAQLLTGSTISLKPSARTELATWCENQLSVFPHRDVDLPTLISLLCDIEETEDVLECIEALFGKSNRVSKFTEAFVEKRADLMRLAV